MLPDWSGKTVLLLGGGPSLVESLSELEKYLPLPSNLGVIAVNQVVYDAPFADMLFFRDLDWYYKNRKAVDARQGIIVSSTVCTQYPKNVQVVGVKHSDDFLVGSEQIRYGRSAGHLALSLAINLGAEKCVLLGYDCRMVDDRSHYHDAYARPNDLVYRTDFLPAWKGWGAAAMRAGVEVVNATPDSAIMEFPLRSLREILTE